MLGYHGTGSRVADNGAFGQADNVILVDVLNCFGTEASIADCPTTNGWNVLTCTQNNDVGVICSTDPPPDKFILVTDSDSDTIYRIDLTTFAHTEIPHDNHIEPIAIGYDHINQKLYWSDVSSKQLKMSDLDGSNFRVLANLQSNAIPEGLAIDPMSGNLFFTDTGTNKISVTSLESFNLMTLVRDLDKPRGIVLHPARGYIFWTDWGSNPKIERANMDGTDRLSLITSGLTWPNGIVIDCFDEKIYWADAYTNNIEKADFDGQNRDILYTGTGHMFGLVLVAEYIYYTDWDESSLMRIDKNGENNMRVGSASFGKLNEITAYTAGEGMCSFSDNGCTGNIDGCSHICVPMPNDDIACLCPDNMDLGVDGKTCAINNIRLVGGTTSLNGRLEVKYDGEWGTVCDDYFDASDARVACAQLGHPNPAAIAWKYAHFGAGSGRIILDDLRCTGTETSLFTCVSTFNHNCGHHEDAGVDCEFSPDPSEVFVRLVGGATANQGRVEVIYRNVTGTICGNNWDEQDARVICSMLGYKGVGSQAAEKGIFGQGEGEIWVDEVNCDGTENLIAQCPTTNGWNVHTCSHEEDAGVICSTEIPADNFILVTDSVNDNIHRIDLTTFAQTEIPHDNHHQPIAIGYDHVEQKLYWSDVMLNELKTSNLDGPNFEVLADLGYEAIPGGLAIDPISRNLFFTDRGTNTISVTSLDVFELISIITLDLDEPRGIALHPAEGYIFWTDWGTNPRIERANMDGTGRVPLITTGLGYPNGIAIDYLANKIYWADAYTDKIEKADFDGQNRETLYTGNGHVYGLVLVGDFIYYTDWRKSSVMRITKNGAANTPVGLATFGKLNEITAYTSAEGIYTLSDNGCSLNRGECSHTCVPLPDAVIKCLCPEEMELDDNGKICE